MQVEKLKLVLQIATNTLQANGYPTRPIYGLLLEDHPETDGNNEVFLFRSPARVGPVVIRQEVAVRFDTTKSEEVLGNHLANQIFRRML